MFGFVLFIGLIGALGCRAVQIYKGDKFVNGLRELLDEDDRAITTGTANRLLSGGWREILEKENVKTWSEVLKIEKKRGY